MESQTTKRHKISMDHLQNEFSMHFCVVFTATNEEYDKFVWHNSKIRIVIMFVIFSQ
jgi:hypothetical protein